MIREARNGGCVTPNYARVLAFWQQTGRLQMHQFTTLESYEWNEAETKAKVCLATKRKIAVDGPNRKSGKGSRQSSHGEEDQSDSENAECTQSSPMGETASTILQVDYVISATGQAFSFASLPFTRRMLRDHPIPVIHGLPLVNEDLQWSPDIPFFAVGAYAALQVGPGSYNLIGIREGADRVAVRLIELAASFKASEAEPPAEEGQDQDKVIAPKVTKKHSPSRFTHFGFELLGEA